MEHLAAQERIFRLTHDPSVLRRGPHSQPRGGSEVLRSDAAQNFLALRDRYLSRRGQK
jgi:hypothetical protein